jgi:hypothetical protein
MEECCFDMKMCVREELRAHLGSNGYKAGYCNDTWKEDHGTKLYESNGTTVGTSSFKDYAGGKSAPAVNGPLNGGLSIDSLTIDFFDDERSADSLDRLIARFRGDTKESVAQLHQVMQKFESQDLQLGDLSEFLVPGGLALAVPSGVAARSDASPAAAIVARLTESRSRPAELIQSLCSTKEEIQYNLQCAMQKANEQHVKFAAVSRLVASLRRIPSYMDSPSQFTPRAAHRRPVPPKSQSVTAPDLSTAPSNKISIRFEEERSRIMPN